MWATRTFLFAEQTSPNFFAQRGRGCGWSFFQMFEIFFGGRGPSKTYTNFITPASRHVAWKLFCEDTATSALVIGAQCWILGQILMFTIKFFRGTPVAVVVCASKSLSICNACKKIEGTAPQGPKCSLPKNVRLGGSITLSFVDQSSANFCRPPEL